MTPEQFFSQQPLEQKIVYNEEESTLYYDEEHGYELKWLIPASNEKEMEPVIITFDKNGEYKTFEPSLSETFIYVIDGSICLTFGEATYIAKKGQTMYYQATEPHQISNNGRGKSRALMSRRNRIYKGRNGGVYPVRNHVISFENVVKQFDDEPVLKNVSFEIEEGKFYTLLGPSGCGKTTILRIIAGFNDVTSGDVYFDGKRINDVPANKRQVNTVFQDYALFPHMNVFDNVAFGLKIKNYPKQKLKKK